MFDVGGNLGAGRGQRSPRSDDRPFFYAENWWIARNPRVPSTRKILRSSCLHVRLGVGAGVDGTRTVG